MIRVNLLRDIGGDRGGSDVAAAMASGGGGGGGVGDGAVSALAMGNNQLVMILKIVILLMPVLLIYAYREYRVSTAKSELNSLTTHMNSMDQKLKTLEPIIKDMDKFQEDKKKLDSQLDIIKNLSKERLKNIKSLDALQNLIPTRVWLTGLKIAENKVELMGKASDDLVISDFIGALSASIYFANVVLDSSEKTTDDSTGSTKKFVIKCNLENL